MQMASKTAIKAMIQLKKTGLKLLLKIKTANLFILLSQMRKCPNSYHPTKCSTPFCQKKIKL